MTRDDPACAVRVGDRERAHGREGGGQPRGEAIGPEGIAKRAVVVANEGQVAAPAAHQGASGSAFGVCHAVRGQEHLRLAIGEGHSVKRCWGGLLRHGVASGRGLVLLCRQGAEVRLMRVGRHRPRAVRRDALAPSNSAPALGCEGRPRGSVGPGTRGRMARSGPPSTARTGPSRVGAASSHRKGKPSQASARRAGSRKARHRCGVRRPSCPWRLARPTRSCAPGMRSRPSAPCAHAGRYERSFPPVWGRRSLAGAIIVRAGRRRRTPPSVGQHSDAPEPRSGRAGCSRSTSGTDFIPHDGGVEERGGTASPPHGRDRRLDRCGVGCVGRGRHRPGREPPARSSRATTIVLSATTREKLARGHDAGLLALAWPASATASRAATTPARPSR